MFRLHIWSGHLKFWAFLMISYHEIYLKMNLFGKHKCKQIIGPLVRPHQYFFLKNAHQRDIFLQGSSLLTGFDNNNSLFETRGSMSKNKKNCNKPHVSLGGHYKSLLKKHKVLKHYYCYKGLGGRGSTKHSFISYMHNCYIRLYQR